MSHDNELEYVVLLDEAGRPCGSADKTAVHSEHTPLHLAFSCWLIDDAGRTLLTRRADTKLTWPSIWSNSFCGHPAPDEDLAHAVARRGRHELGVDLVNLRVVLPDFRYTARMANGISENEVCPVYVAEVRAEVVPNPVEVGDHVWVEWAQLRAEVIDDPERFSPWLRLQLPELLEQVAR